MAINLIRLSLLVLFLWVPLHHRLL